MTFVFIFNFSRIINHLFDLLLFRFIIIILYCYLILIFFKIITYYYHLQSYNDLCILKSKKSTNQSTQREVVKGGDPKMLTNSKGEFLPDDQSEEIDDELTLEPGKVVRASFEFVPMICDVGGTIEVGIALIIIINYYYCKLFILLLLLSKSIN